MSSHRRASRLGATNALLAAVVIALIACGGGGESGDGEQAPIGPTTSTLPRSVTGAVDLTKLVVAGVPDGYARLAAPPFGPVDLERVLDTFSDSPEADRQILVETGFLRGYTRGWRQEDPFSFLGVYVFEFADPEGARTAQELFGLQMEQGREAMPFAVDQIPSAAGLRYSGDEEGQFRRTHLVMFVRGPRLYLVNGQTDDPDGGPEITLELVTRQHEVAA